MGKKTQKLPLSEQYLLEGQNLIKAHPLFGRMSYQVQLMEYEKGFGGSACISDSASIYVNRKKHHTPQEWAYILAHLLLHLGLGHTNPDRVSKGLDLRLWNIACDIYVTKFLRDIKFAGQPDGAMLLDEFAGSMKDEKSIYQYLLQHENEAVKFAVLGTYGGQRDLCNLEEIWDHSFYRWRGNDYYEKEFASALQHSVKSVLQAASTEYIEEDTPSRKAARWFLNSYPLLGGLAAHFKVIEDADYCHKYDISVAAIDVSAGEIYVNPAAGLGSEQLKFVLAHEYLHAGLDHAARAQGRDRELWNVACDYVINSWLKEMKIGLMPEMGLLYDEELEGMSAEEVYDELVRKLRTAKKLATFRGIGKGDIMGGGMPDCKGNLSPVSLDDFCKNALLQGLEYQMSSGRGLIPAGLVEEIRALAMPPIPWDVKLAAWFDDYFAPIEKHRTYARPSRRQASTPDIPRPRYLIEESQTEGRTFGVVIDTSGSMSARDIGIALGAIASYADAKDVPKMRVVFCDAAPYDKGYLAPEEVAGRVEVVGRGGTVLQPGIDLLENSKTFPKDGPILIITDGMIENNLRVKREHAFLLPKGKTLPFRPVGKVFYFSE